MECLERVLGHCPKCIKDEDPKHHPNNYDCPGYKPVGLLIYEVKDTPPTSDTSTGIVL